jgi:hypothetical protein
LYFVHRWTMAKVQERSNSECYTPLSGSFMIYLHHTIYQCHWRMWSLHGAHFVGILFVGTRWEVQKWDAL